MGIVTRLKAAELPECVRKGIDPNHLVEVVVTDLGRPQRSGDELVKMMNAYHDRLRQHPELAEIDPVGRVRALRDEWDD